VGGDDHRDQRASGDVDEFGDEADAAQLRGRIQRKDPTSSAPSPATNPAPPQGNHSGRSELQTG
jgi:hypothetical protein